MTNRRSGGAALGSSLSLQDIMNGRGRARLLGGGRCLRHTAAKKQLAPRSSPRVARTHHLKSCGGCVPAGCLRLVFAGREHFDLGSSASLPKTLEDPHRNKFIEVHTAES